MPPDCSATSGHAASLRSAQRTSSQASAPSVSSRAPAPSVHPARPIYGVGAITTPTGRSASAGGAGPPPAPPPPPPAPPPPAPPRPRPAPRRRCAAPALRAGPAHRGACGALRSRSRPVAGEACRTPAPDDRGARGRGRGLEGAGRALPSRRRPACPGGRPRGAVPRQSARASTHGPAVAGGHPGATPVIGTAPARLRALRHGRRAAPRRRVVHAEGDRGTAAGCRARPGPGRESSGPGGPLLTEDRVLEDHPATEPPGRISTPA